MSGEIEYRKKEEFFVNSRKKRNEMKGEEM